MKKVDETAQCGKTAKDDKIAGDDKNTEEKEIEGSQINIRSIHIKMPESNFI